MYLWLALAVDVTMILLPPTCETCRGHIRRNDPFSTQKAKEKLTSLPRLIEGENIRCLFLLMLVCVKCVRTRDVMFPRGSAYHERSSLQSYWIFYTVFLESAATLTCKK